MKSSEKEQVYAELAMTRRKLAALKAEIRRLNGAMRERTPVAVNAERARLRQALSDIAYNPHVPVDAEHYRQIAKLALNPLSYVQRRGKGAQAKAFRAGLRADRDAARERARHIADAR